MILGSLAHGRVPTLAVISGSRNGVAMAARNPVDVHVQLAAALNAGDRDAFADLHEDGATVVVPTRDGHVTGRQEILAAMEPLFAMRPHVDIEVVGKLESDGLALTHGHWSLVGSVDGERTDLSGRGTIVSRRQADGSWRIVFDNPLSHA
jgi:uncharacterized protein (TIGR02246 family)